MSKWLVPARGLAALALITVFPAALPAHAQEKVVNLYSSRHYSTDEALYSNFTKQTGIKINRIEASEDPLIERIRNEGDKSPADVLLTVDAGRLWRVEQLGFFQPVKSQVLDARIPANLRHPDGLWYAFSVRARVIAYDKAKVKPGDIATYEDLANPKWKGKICTRSGAHMYNVSLGASMIGATGLEKTENWAKGVAANLARTPKGGDTDQMAAVAAGECELALVNTYYYARLSRSAKPEDKAIADKIGIITPNQAAGERGTHVNVSGAGVMKNAPNRENAIRFLEYLASDEAQKYFAEGNNEWPAVASTQTSNPVLVALGKFRYDTQNIVVLGRNQPEAQKAYDRAGWK